MGNSAAQPMDDKLRVLILGLGGTGLSCARYLGALGVRVAVADSRQEPPGLADLRESLPDLAVFLGPFTGGLIEGIDLLVVSPGIPVSDPLVRAAAARGIPVIGDVELFVRAAAEAPVVAITGSNGKSSVTTLLGNMCRAAGIRVAVGGNLGTPALDLLADGVELYVLELSSFQLETTASLQAAVAAVLNVSSDHMDRYASLDDYAAAKARILNNAGVAVLNLDDPRVMAMQGAGDTWTFTLGEPAGAKCFGLRDVAGATWLCRGSTPLMAAGELAVPGRHNLANVLACMAMATALGIEPAVQRSAATAFRGLPHRTELVAEHAGVQWYNDSKGTNVGACRAALEGLHADAAGRTVLIAGGDCKGADFTQLGPVLAECARAVVLLGRDRDLIARVVPATVPTVTVADMDEAVARSAELALPGDRVLLSPGCASFDMFDGFAARGDAFAAAVGRLLA